MDTNSRRGQKCADMKAPGAYALADLLGGRLAMSIPDMQRDFCWGKEKVAALAEGLVRLHAEGRSATLGVLYGYESPAGSRHINIIDGQQRLTALYLLLGMLYRRVPEPWLRRLLISDYELIDDYEPRLLYQARREALYFMSDLVTRFFLDRDGRLSQIEQSDWYYASYDSDATVRHFIIALRSIDQCLERAAERPGWDFAAFARYVAYDLQFLYWDLGDRQSAERMFITINTTGEPLTLSQNLRAFCYAAQQGSAEASMEMWNEMEDWFWMRRGCEACSLDDLARMYLKTKGIAMTGNLPVDVASLAASSRDVNEMMGGFYGFFKSYRRLAELGEDPQGEYPLLASVRYLERFPQAQDASLRRLWRYFANIARYQRPSASDPSSAAAFVDLMPGEDVLSLLDGRRLPERFFNREERAKLEYIAAHIQERERAEQLIARAESHPMLNGRAAKVLEWCRGNLDALRRYVDAIYKIWGGSIDKLPSLDPLRRAMLTLGHRDYPIVRRGETVLSLCWNDYDWQRLMQTAPGLIRLTVDRVVDLSGERNLTDRGVAAALAEMADRYDDERSPYYAIVKNPELLADCRKRQLLRPCGPFLGIFDLRMKTTRWMVDQQEIERPRGWGPLRAYGNRCLYADHKTLDLAVDLYFRPGDRKPFRLEVFGRGRDECPPEKRPCNIRSLVSGYGGLFFYDKARGRYAATFPSGRRAASVIQSILDRYGESR